MTDRFRNWLLGAALATVATGAITLVAVTYVPPPPAPAPAPPPKGWDKVEPRLAQLDKKAAEAAQKRIDALKAFLERRAQGADDFAKEALSWGGKWELVKAKLGYGNHEQFLQDAFDRHVITQDALKSAVASALAGYVSDLDGLENAMLVQLRADLEDGELGRGGVPFLANDEAFRKEYWRLTAALLPMLTHDLEFSVGREIAAFIAMDVGTQVTMQLGSQVASQLGIDTTVLGSGALGGLTTLGVGLIVGYVVDQVIDWVLHQMGYDPEAEIASRVRNSMYEIEALLIDGDSGAKKAYAKVKKMGQEDKEASVREACENAASRIVRGGKLGLKWELGEIEEGRARLRGQALRNLLTEGGRP